MKVRILACIQAAALVLSSFPSMASTVSADNQVVGIEAEAETKIEAETETGDVAKTETQDATEAETEDVTETEIEAETEYVTETGTEAETETELEDDTETETEDVTKTEDVMENGTEAADNIDTAQYLTTVDAAGEKLREALTNREAEITVYYRTTKKPDGEIANKIWDAALAHTGKPTEGDYIRFQYEGLEIPDFEIIELVSVATENDETSAETTYYLPITYQVSYDTTYEQEMELKCAVETVIDDFDFNEDTSDDQKIKAIYDYICGNCANGNLDNPDDTLKHTAYAALINKTAQSQGMSSLLYRLLLECGIDARIISGTVNGENHVWNIVKCGDFYYYLDAAWDCGKTSYDCFLKGSENFSDHMAEADYTSEEFATSYPISATDMDVYDVDNVGEESGDGTKVEDSTEAETEMETETQTKAESDLEEILASSGTSSEADTEGEGEPAGIDVQESDKRPSITADGVLFPGKKEKDYSVVYTGEKICPAMTVTYTYQDGSGKSKTQTLKLNVDYTVTYRNNINVGGAKATVTVKGIGEYQGTVTKEFDITKKSISKAVLSAVGDIKFGEKPAVTVMEGTKELVENTDYTVSYPEGNANTTTTSTLTVKAVESESCNYTGTVSKTAAFNILGTDMENAVPITDVRVEWKNPGKTYVYNGKAQKPAVVVTDKEGKKVPSSCYKVLYTNNVNAGTNTAKAYVVGVTKKGAGYYGTSEPLSFTIVQKNFSKVSASIKGTLPKFGTISDIQNAINEAVVVKDGKMVLSYGEDYIINYGDITSLGNIKIGTKYEIKISRVREDGNYTSDTKSLQIKFGQLNLASMTAVTSLTLTNVEEKKATLTYNGKTLEQDRDYTVVSVKQDKKTGSYTVKIKAAKGSDYKGSLTFKDVQGETTSSTTISMTLDKSLITGETGETVPLKAVIPSEVQVGTITWKSSDQDVATVTDEGLVSLVGSGMAVITASASVSVESKPLDLTAQCQVIVKGSMEEEAFVDVTDNGAVPGDGKDDWEAIQGALDDSKNHTAYVPAGVYDIDLVEHNGIVMRKGYKLYMHKDAVLRAMKTSKTECQVINVGSSGHKDDPDYYSNIEISGGTIIGDLQETGKKGEGVMGIRVQYAKNIYIHDVTVKECRGDGIYVGGNGKGSTNIFITGCTIQDNLRNCLGIVSAHNLYVDNCNISGAGSLFGGVAPRACILIEKNKGDDTCTDIVIKNSTIDNAKVCSSQSEAYAFGSSTARGEIHGDRLTVENCDFKGKVANYSTKNAKFINCTFDRDPILKQGTIVQ